MSPSPQKNESGTGDGRLDVVQLVLFLIIALAFVFGAIVGVVLFFAEIVVRRVIPPLVEALNQLFPHAHESPIWSLAVGSLVFYAMGVGIVEILGSPPLNRLRPSPEDPNAAPSLGILPKATSVLLSSVVVPSAYFLLIIWIDLNTLWAAFGPALSGLIVLEFHVRLRRHVYAQPLLRWLRLDYFQDYFQAIDVDEDRSDTAAPSNGNENDFDPSATQRLRVHIWSMCVSSTAIYGALMAIASTQEGARPAWLWPLAALGVVLFSAGFFVFRTQALDPVRSRTLDLSAAKDTERALNALLFAWAMAMGMALCGPWLVYFQENPARYGWPFLAGAALLLFITRPWALTPHPK